jgi:hypothetical protein
MTEKIKFEKGDIVSVLKHLNELVVSLDRITSAYHDVPRDTWKEIVVEYFLESESLKALSMCRRILEEPFSRKLGADDMDELDRALEGTKFWSYREFCNRRDNLGESAEP